MVRSGLIAVQHLRADRVHPPAGHDLVEDQQRAGAPGDGSRSPSRKPGAGGTTPMFPATGSTSTAAMSDPRAANSGLDRGEIVERRDQRVGDGGRR